MTSPQECEKKNDHDEEARREIARELGHGRGPLPVYAPLRRPTHDDPGHGRQRPGPVGHSRPAALGTYCGDCNARQNIAAAELAALLGCPNVIAPEGYCGFVNRDIKFSGGGHERAHRMAAYRGSSHLGGIHHDPD